MALSDRSLHRLPKSAIFSVVYHDIFDYPLDTANLRKWQCNFQFSNSNFQINTKIINSKGYFFLKGREKLIKLRERRKKCSEYKLQIAKKAAKILDKTPTVLFVGITGSLAMQNARGASDIDLLIITKNGLMWTSRILVYVFCGLFGIKVRKPGDKHEKDKLCLNMWLDESDLYFDKQNIFTAHELAQIVPLVNKDKTFEKLININNWIFDYWPSAVQVQSTKCKVQRVSTITSFIESIAYQFQLRYMKNKRTKEVITATRAFFHPFDWGEKVIEQLNQEG